LFELDLDAESVKWLGSYLISQHELTCMIVSHDTAFLDRVVTDVIHYEQRKLVYYHGTLSHFVELHPEAKYYFDLESSTLRFVFPIPERLEGINSTTKSVLKLDNVTFTYPGASKPTIRDANVKLCLGSRVAVLGPNGAGKSTLIKLLVKETEPDLTADGDSRLGEVWKHHNLRIAYVAQHSLHHVEQHLEKSPVDYIKWRFEKGYDKEDMQKSALKLTEEELDTLKADREYGDVLEIHGRRKNGRTMEYECSFVGQTSFEENKYVPIEELIEKGLEKLVQQADTRIAAMAAGLDVRPLLIKEIQRHLDDFNLESEFGTHSKIRRLSGGQKVKLVLAAAMWNRPHIIVLDEPTNVSPEVIVFFLI
jgi:ATPase subunit of ABC transporter with duplicated ATPase domains